MSCVFEPMNRVAASESSERSVTERSPLVFVRYMLKPALKSTVVEVDLEQHKVGMEVECGWKWETPPSS